MAERGTAADAPAEPVVRDVDGSRVLDFDNGTVQSRMLDAEPTRLVLEYTRLMMGFLLLHPAPARIAMIGLGGGSLAKYCRARLPDVDFTAVEISAAVIALRDRFAVPADGARFRIVCADGAAFVRRADGNRYDALLVDGFDRGGQPPDLCSVAFYDACQTRLADGGVLVVNLHTDEPDCDACVERLARAFDGRIVAIRADHSANLVVFAGAAPSFPPPFAAIVERLRELEPSHPVELGVAARKIIAYRPPPQERRRRRT